MPVPQSDYYSILGVSRDASQEDIKRAYLQAAQKLHPDKNTAAGETELFLDAQIAYEMLSNPKSRAQYDATLSPEEKIDLPYEYQIVYSRPSLVHLDEPQMLYVILDLQAPIESRRNPSPPLNVCIVLDRSTSMKGEKMDVVKSTAVQILRNLRPQDILSIVAFSDRAEVIIPASYHQDRSRLEARIQMIQPSGGTEMFQGLDAGAKEVMRSHDAKRLNHIILLTDGQTYGGGGRVHVALWIERGGVRLQRRGDHAAGEGAPLQLAPGVAAGGRGLPDLSQAASRAVRGDDSGHRPAEVGVAEGGGSGIRGLVQRRGGR
jgi:Ca-activated chloride channel family protein